MNGEGCGEELVVEERVIVVMKRADHFNAYLKGRSEVWERGVTASEAIGNLIRSHQDALRVAVEWPKDGAK